MKRTLTINLFGGPGTGKSTLAADIFAALKRRRISCELITEFAKDLTWEHNTAGLANQAYIFGNQYYRMCRCADSVDVLITDSPLLLSVLHRGKSDTPSSLDQAVVDAFHQFNNRNYLLCGTCEYDPCGRNESGEEAAALSRKLRALLDEWAIPCVELLDNMDPDGGSGCRQIVAEVMEALHV